MRSAQALQEMQKLKKLLRQNVEYLEAIEHQTDRAEFAVKTAK